MKQAKGQCKKEKASRITFGASELIQALGEHGRRFAAAPFLNAASSLTLAPESVHICLATLYQFMRCKVICILASSEIVPSAALAVGTHHL